MRLKVGPYQAVRFKGLVQGKENSTGIWSRQPTQRGRSSSAAGWKQTGLDLERKDQRMVGQIVFKVAVLILSDRGFAVFFQVPQYNTPQQCSYTDEPFVYALNSMLP